MSQPDSQLFAFDGFNRIASGPRAELQAIVSAYLRDKPQAQALIFDSSSGRQVDLDWRPTAAAEAKPDADANLQRTGKGRPKLGVVAREVTLLPRHWDWLASQPGGASATLRKLIERASKGPDLKEQQQARATAAYHFMHAVAGNLPGFEEASRLLFAGKSEELKLLTARWPGDIGNQVMALATS